MKRFNFFSMGLKICISLLFLALELQNSTAQDIIFDKEGGWDGGIGSDGFYYELWMCHNDSCWDGREGSSKMWIYDNCLFRCEWENASNVVARRGLKYDSDKRHEEIGTFTVDYNCDYNPVNISGGNSYLAIYGWTVDPTQSDSLVEFYIIENYINWNPSQEPSAIEVGNFDIDGANYKIIKNYKENAPNISGVDQNFWQYFSIRQDERLREEGFIQISEHFKTWEETEQMPMGNMYEVSFAAEGFKNNGDAEFTKLDFNVETISVDSIVIELTRGAVFDGQKVDWLGLENERYRQKTYNYTIYPEDATNTHVSINVDMNASVELNEGESSFTVTAETVGEALVTLTTDDGGKTDDILFGIFEDYPDNFTKEYNDIHRGEIFDAWVPFESGAENIIYVSAEPTIATVDENGIITTVGPGDVIIWAFEPGHVNSEEGKYFVIRVQPDNTEAMIVNVKALSTQEGGIIDLVVDGDHVRTWRLSETYENNIALLDHNTGDVHVEFMNDDDIENGLDVRVDYIMVNGVKRETEEMESNSAAYDNGYCGGGSYTEWLHCNGSVNYGPINDVHTITVRARGTSGGEHMDLLINGNPVNSGWWLTTGYQEYTVEVEGDGDINVEYDNDYGDYRDVVVDWVRVDDQNVRQAENMEFNTGAYANGYCGGGSYTEWLHCNGVIGFGNISSDFKSEPQPESMSEASPVHVYPNPGSGNVTIEIEGSELNAGLEVVDFTGKVVYSATGITENLVEVSGLSSGLYYVNVKTNGNSYTNKLVIR